MSYPKISTVVASQLMVSSGSVKGNIPMAVVVTAPRGQANQPEVFFKDRDLVTEFGKPDLPYGKSLLYADTLLKNATDNLTVVRAVSGSSKYAGALLKSKIGEENLTDLSQDIIVECSIAPLTGGLTQNELDTYTFPQYARTREYSKIDSMTYAVTQEVSGNKIYVKKEDIFPTGISFAVSNTVNPPATNAPMYNTTSIDRISQDKNIAEVTVSITEKLAVTSDKIHYLIDSNNNHIRLGNIYKSSDLVAQGKTQKLLTMTADYLHNGTDYKIYDSEDVEIATVNVTSKKSITEKVYVIELDHRPAGNFYNSVWYKVTARDFEPRDCALLVSRGTGIDNNHISYGVFDNRLTEDSFTLVVYYKGKEVESHSCSMNPEVDGNGIQLEITEVINNNSRYCKVLKNPAMIDGSKIMKPITSEKVRWQRKAEPFYRPTTSTTVEDILVNDIEVKVNNVSGLSVNDRIIFKSADNSVSKEYKVFEISATTKVLKLDRPLEEINQVLLGSDILKVDVTYNLPDSNIYEGYTRFPVQVINDVVYPTAKGTYKEVGGHLGYVYDGGANPLGGGSDGASVTMAEIINTLQTILSVEKYPYFFIGDSGWTDPSYKRALINLAQKRVTTLAFTSSKLSSELSASPVAKVSQDFVDIAYTSSAFGISAGWFKMTNPYTLQTGIPMPPSLSDLLVEAGAIAKDGIWTASAGWRKGQYFTDGLIYEFDEAERKVLYSRGINTTKVKAYKGTAKWSDLTGLNQERPLQYKSIAKLVIYTIHSLLNYLEDIHFEDYDENEISSIQGNISEFLEEIINSGGMYDAKVVIGDLVTDRKISERVLPIFVAITGKQFIQGINLGLEVQQGTQTKVNLATANKLTA